MMKRTFVLLLALLMVVCALPSTIHAAEVSGEWEYKLSQGYAVITKYTGSGTEIRIPSSLDDYTVIGIGDGVFKGNTTLTQVYFPDSLESIGSSAFEECNSLRSIEFPENLEDVGQSAFGGCTALSKITVNSIKLSDFYMCGDYTYGTLLASVHSAAPSGSWCGGPAAAERR